MAAHLKKCLYEFEDCFCGDRIVRMGMAKHLEDGTVKHIVALQKSLDEQKRRISTLMREFDEKLRKQNECITKLQRENAKLKTNME